MSDHEQQRATLPASYVAEVEAVIGNAIKVADELISVALEETKRLASGRPVQIQDLVERKERLATEFDTFLQKYKAEQHVFLIASERKFAELQEKTALLAQVLIQNTEQLKLAVTANERRVDTIIRAVREQQTAISPYSANGQQMNSISTFTSMHPGLET